MKRQQCICNHCTHCFHKTLLLLIVLYVGRTYPPFTPPYIFILHNENLFFLTYPLQIPYIRNRFYNRVEVASMPESAKAPMLFASVFFCALHIEDSFYA
ncbi:hypothetical protein FOS03_23500 [Bacillus paranthracis]|nr:hypothetical protein BACI_c30990 [Bacillus cereus biovar anthracis str. CI]MDR4323556.1 hypothetical protein [Bacillus paranthracis]